MKSVYIVDGPDQAAKGIINSNAPIAKALLWAEVGDEVPIYLPTGMRTIRVLKIEMPTV